MKMTISEKVEQATKSAILTLYKEGIFYKCYNEDAMVFACRVKKYKITSKFVKKVGADVFSLGFPVNEVSKGNLSFEHIGFALATDKYEDEMDKVKFYLKDDLKHGYKKWQEEHVKEKTPQYVNESGSNQYKTKVLSVYELINQIKHFDLANSTPMQGLNFIQRLKLEIQKIETNGNI